MFDKECRICGDSFQAKTERRQLCDKCQKNSAKVQAKFDQAIYESKMRLGELPSQQYYTCQCDYCGKEFHSYGQSRKFCSNECSQEHNIHTAVCPVCKAKLFPLGIIVKRGSKCCSEKCAEQLRFDNARYKGKVAVCKACAKEFIQKKYWDEYCSRQCETSNQIEIARQQGTLALCKTCGKEFIRTASYKLTCSVACETAYIKTLPPKTVEGRCEICGKTFQRHVNATKYTCSKECSGIRAKAKQAAQKAVKEA